MPVLIQCTFCHFLMFFHLVAGSPKCTVPSAKSDKETGQKNKNAKTKINLISKNTKKPLKRQQTKSKLDDAKEEPSTNETDKKSSTRDLRSIVKKNIGKYREMREKQKLANKSQIKSCKSRIAVPIITRNRYLTFIFHCFILPECLVLTSFFYL